MGGVSRDLWVGPPRRVSRWEFVDEEAREDADAGELTINRLASFDFRNEIIKHPY